MKEADLRQVATERISQFVLKRGERFLEQQSNLIDYLKDSIQSFDLPHSHCDSVNAKGRQRTERFNETCIAKAHTDARSRNHCCSGKANSISYSERVRMSVALFIEKAKRMPRVILPSVPCMALPHYSTLYDARTSSVV